MRSILRWLAIVVCFAGAASAHADPALAEPANPAAHAHLDRGVKFYDLRDFEKAIEEYKQGALIQSIPLFDFALGQCYRQLGKYQDAIWHYERFLKHGHPRGKVLDAINDFIIQMRAELDKKAVTQPPTESPPATSPQPRQAAMLQPNMVPATTQIDRGQPWYADQLGSALTATGVIGLAIGGGFLLSAKNIHEQADLEPDQSLRRPLRDKAHTRNVVGTIAGIGGAAFLVTGIIKLILHSQHRAQLATWDLAASGDGVMVTGRF